MTAIAALLVLIGLIVLGLQHNHARQRYHRPGLAGSGTVIDRDVERVLADLAVTGARDTDPGRTVTVPRREHLVLTP
jgi:hypothetical protein